MAILWDPRLTQLKAMVDNSTVDYTKRHWRIIAAWITVNGNWDDVPVWAKQWQQDTLGGDHHAFGRALFKDGSVADQAGFVLSWPDGDAQRTPEPDGWANLPIQASFDPSKGPGPYRWAKYGNAEVFCGAGLPYPLPWASAADVEPEGGHHVSFFAVWQETEPEAPPVPDDWERIWLRVGPFTFGAEVRAR